MTWRDIFDHLAGRRYATVEDVRKIFADYHDTLHWLAGFLIGEELAPACVVDACNIAERQSPVFHEWLAHWAARATLRCAFQREHEAIAALGHAYDVVEPVAAKRPPLSPEDLQILVEHSDVMEKRLDVLCRFVLIIHGIAKESSEDVAGQLGVSPMAVEHAYCVAYDTLQRISEKALPDADKVLSSSRQTKMLA